MLLVASLTKQLEAAHTREVELMRQLAEKDAQIRLVLEEKFFHPVITRPPGAPEPKSTVAVDGDELTDVVRYPPAGDQDRIAKDAEAEKAAQERYDDAMRKIEEEIDELVAEHEADHPDDEDGDLMPAPHLASHIEEPPRIVNIEVPGGRY